MKRYSIKSIKNNEKGITLVALLTTVAVMLIIVGVSIGTGTDSISSTRLKGFYSQLELIQKRVDDIASTNEGYYNSSQTYVDIKTQTGSALTSEQKTFLQGVLSAEGLSSIPVDEFKYYTKENLKEQLDLSEMDYNVFIHYNTRTIVSEKGVKSKGKTYYVLENSTYFVEQNTNKNQGTISLTYSIAKYGTSNYKIIVTPTKIGDLNATGTLKYKEATSKYWETANGLEIVINKLAQYNVEYVDSNKNTVSQTITVSLDSDSNPVVTVN